MPVQSFVSDMQRLTRRHTTMKCYGLGLGLDTFRIVSLGENFRRLDPIPLMNTYSRSVPLHLLRHARLCVTPSDVVCHMHMVGASI